MTCFWITFIRYTQSWKIGSQNNLKSLGAIKPMHLWEEELSINKLHKPYKGPSWSLLYGSWIYNYLCNHCLSPLKLWVRYPLMTRCNRYYIMGWSLSLTCSWSVVSPDALFPQQNWPPRYNWNYLQSGVKYHNSNPNPFFYVCFACLYTSIEHLVGNHYNFVLKPHSREPHRWCNS